MRNDTPADIILLDTVTGIRVDLARVRGGPTVYLPISNYFPFDKQNFDVLARQADDEYAVGVGYWKASNPSRLDDVQVFVTGTPEPGETPDQTAAREVAEETGIRLDTLDYQPPPLHSFTAAGKHWTNLVYRVGAQARLVDAPAPATGPPARGRRSGVGVIMYGTLARLLDLYQQRPTAGLLPRDGDRIRYVAFIRLGLVKVLARDQFRFRCDDMHRSHLQLSLVRVNNKPAADFSGSLLGYTWVRGKVQQAASSSWGRHRRQPNYHQARGLRVCG